MSNDARAILHRALSAAGVLRGKVHDPAQGSAIAELQKTIATHRAELHRLGAAGSEAETLLDAVQVLASSIAIDPTNAALLARFDAAFTEADTYRRA